MRTLFIFYQCGTTKRQQSFCKVVETRLRIHCRWGWLVAEWYAACAWGGEQAPRDEFEKTGRSWLRTWACLRMGVSLVCWTGGGSAKYGHKHLHSNGVRGGLEIDRLFTDNSMLIVRQGGGISGVALILLWEPGRSYRWARISILKIWDEFLQVRTRCVNVMCRKLWLYISGYCEKCSTTIRRTRFTGDTPFSTRNFWGFASTTIVCSAHKPASAEVLLVQMLGGGTFEECPALPSSLNSLAFQKDE